MQKSILKQTPQLSSVIFNHQRFCTAASMLVKHKLQTKIACVFNYLFRNGPFIVKRTVVFIYPTPNVRFSI
eukprot:g51868.t1